MTQQYAGLFDFLKKKSDPTKANITASGGTPTASGPSAADLWAQTGLPSPLTLVFKPSSESAPAPGTTAPPPATPNWAALGLGALVLTGGVLLVGVSAYKFATRV